MEYGHSLRGPRRQRGAAAMIAGVGLVAMLAAVFLTLDISNLYFAKRVMQKQASMAALDGAREVSGCSTDQLPSSSDIDTAVQNSLTRNSFDSLTGATAGITPGVIEIDSGTSLRYLRETSAAEAKAVGVTLQRPFPKAFLPFLRPAGSNTLTVSATAEQAARGSLFLGTGIAELDEGLLNALLGALLCAPGDTDCQANVISLDVADSASGLLSTNVSLGQLAIALGLSVSDLSDPLNLTTQTPILSDVLNGLVSGLGDTVSTTVSGLLTNLAAAAEGNRREIPLGLLLGTVDDIAAQVPFINLMDLILGLGQAAQADDDGEIEPIALPVELDIPGVASVRVFLQILDPPQASGLGRAGFTEASTAQVKLLVRISAGEVLNVITGIVNGLLSEILDLLEFLTGGLVDAEIHVLEPPLNIGIDVDVAAARATLDEITCPRLGGTNNGFPIAQLSAMSSIANVAVGTFAGTADDASELNSGTSDWELLLLRFKGPIRLVGQLQLTVNLGLTSVGVGGSGALEPLDDVDQSIRIQDLPPGTPPAFLAYGAPDAPPAVPTDANPQTLDAPVIVRLDLGLDTEADPDENYGLLGSLSYVLDGLLDAVFAVLQPLLDLVNGLADLLINPLLNLLGIHTGTATVTMESVVVGQPQLVSVAVPVPGAVDEE